MLFLNLSICYWIVVAIRDGVQRKHTHTHTKMAAVCVCVDLQDYYYIHNKATYIYIHILFKIRPGIEVNVCLSLPRFFFLIKTNPHVSTPRNGALTYMLCIYPNICSLVKYENL